ncbi:hypothetical protein [Pseudooceanicola sp. MF1-13]|uniref:hypothetical protein n=1 Tax=Pseudooceanicola sp. MF1-13 TaxID=3379095 RepID=UPI0038923F8D
MSDRRMPLFLGRVSYRQRRLADAARVLPVIGGALMALPLLWPRGGAEGTPATSTAMIYVFGVWALLTALSALLSALLDPNAAGEGELGESTGEITESPDIRSGG